MVIPSHPALDDESLKTKPLAPVQRLSPLVTRIMGCNPSSMTLQGSCTYLIGAGRERILVDTGAGESSWLTLVAHALNNGQDLLPDLDVEAWAALQRQQQAQQQQQQPQKNRRQQQPKEQQRQGQGRGQGQNRKQQLSPHYYSTEEEQTSCRSSRLQNEKNNARITHVVLTHWHADHVGGIDDIITLMRENTAVTDDVVEVPPLKWSSQSPTMLPRLYKVPAPDHDEPVIAAAHHHGCSLQPLNDGDTISVDDVTLRVMHTPGHTDDHCSLYLEQENAIFAGDCVLGAGTTVFTDLGAYMDSLEKLRKLDAKRVYPGHGPPVEQPTELITAYIQHRVARECQIVDTVHALGNLATPAQVVRAVYPQLDEKLVVVASALVKLHLDKLKDEGRAICVNQGQRGVEFDDGTCWSMVVK